MKKLITGYDNNGTVYDNEFEIIREINSNYYSKAVEIFKIFETNNLEKIGIVNTKLNAEDKNFIHKKYPVSYPFEWSANMFKDAILLHLKLNIDLDKYDLCLKDSLPNNIVFNYNKPVFVDFLSIVKKQDLQNEKWLGNQKKYNDLRMEIFEQMMVPFMIIPLIAYAQNKPNLARNLLQNKACNAGGQTPKFEDLNIYLDKLNKPSLTKKIRNFLKKKKTEINNDIENLIEHILNIKNYNFIEFCQKTISLIEKIDVSPPASNYDSYYESKKENFNFNDKSNWKNKQNVVYDSITANDEIETILDLGANTGWFSMLGESLNKKVIAVEIDESSIDKIYKESLKKNLNILALQGSFLDIEKEKFGDILTDEVYKKQNFKEIPIFSSMKSRISSDLVLCLALSHHLILGEGIDIKVLVKQLSEITNKTLVLEHIELDDELIKNDPSFFKNISKFNFQNYNIDLVIKESLNYFKSYTIKDSHPSSRKLIILKK
jgi:hypothetical protein